MGLWGRGWPLPDRGQPRPRTVIGPHTPRRRVPEPNGQVPSPKAIRAPKPLLITTPRHTALLLQSFSSQVVPKHSLEPQALAPVRGVHHHILDVPHLRACAQTHAQGRGSTVESACNEWNF